MILMGLKFERNNSWSNDEKEPLIGTAVFKSKEGTIALTLNDVEAAEILKICSTSLARTLKEKAEGMSAALSNALAHNKRIEIGNNIPSQFG